MYLINFAPTIALLLQEEGNEGAFAGLFSLFCNCIGLIIAIIAIVGLWKVFTKAGEPGWAAIIPIYNTFVWLKIVGRPWWWLLLLLIPFVNFIVMILISLDLAKAFGKSTGFALGLIFLSPIFLILLGFGDAQYQGAPN
jgi:hypothetical protein